jgi:hypothetical protein
LIIKPTTSPPIEMTVKKFVTLPHWFSQFPRGIIVINYLFVSNSIFYWTGTFLNISRWSRTLGRPYFDPSRSVHRNLESCASALFWYSILNTEVARGRALTSWWTNVSNLVIFFQICESFYIRDCPLFPLWSSLQLWIVTGPCPPPFLAVARVPSLWFYGLVDDCQSHWAVISLRRCLCSQMRRQRPIEETEERTKRRIRWFGDGLFAGGHLLDDGVTVVSVRLTFLSQAIHPGVSDWLCDIRAHLNSLFLTFEMFRYYQMFIFHSFVDVLFSRSFFLNLFREKIQAILIGEFVSGLFLLCFIISVICHVQQDTRSSTRTISFREVVSDCFFFRDRANNTRCYQCGMLMFCAYLVMSKASGKSTRRQSFRTCRSSISAGPGGWSLIVLDRDRPWHSLRRNHEAQRETIRRFVWKVFLPNVARHVGLSSRTVPSIGCPVIV